MQKENLCNHAAFHTFPGGYNLHKSWKMYLSDGFAAKIVRMVDNVYHTDFASGPVR
jgi:hypothetical protein